VPCSSRALALVPMDQFLPVLLMLALALVFAIGSFVASRVLAPSGRLNPAKTSPYESGIAPRHEPPARFPVRFYLVGMIFIIFDIEVVFLYPFAVMSRELAVFGLVEMASFAAVVFIAFAYLVSEGALNWGPPKRLGSRSGAPVPRDLTATVRRVGRPGTHTQAPQTTKSFEVAANRTDGAANRTEAGQRQEATAGTARGGA
jgi:NADH-quinone oxidoreductase subunit A